MLNHCITHCNRKFNKKRSEKNKKQNTHTLEKIIDFFNFKFIRQSKSSFVGKCLNRRYQYKFSKKKKSINSETTHLTRWGK